MKKALFLLLFLVSVSFWSYSQVLTLFDADDNPIPNGSDIHVPADQMFTYIHVMNTSANSIHARAKKIHHYVAPEDKIHLCWLGCEAHEKMIAPPLDRDPVTIHAGATDEGFDLTYFTGGSTENSSITLIFYYEENLDDSVYLNVTLGPNEKVGELLPFGNEIVNAYPNPASNYVNIDVEMETTENAEVVFFNVLGKEIYRQQITDSKEAIHLNTANWINGVYYYTLVNNSRKITTQKLMINH